METFSVIIQVLSFKWRGKRVFRMAPIHHHFELKGWNEGKIVVRFWIISMILALIALSTLKLRWTVKQVCLPDDILIVGSRQNGCSPHAVPRGHGP